MILISEVLSRHIIRFLLTSFVLYQLTVFITEIPAQDLPRSTQQSDQRMQYRNQAFRSGDAVEISVYPDTSSFLHGIFPIDGEGFINLPIKGKIKIIEMSSTEFSEYLTVNYKQYIRTPDVLVRPLIRVSLLGGFRTPGLYYVQENLTLWQLVQRAGGTIHEKGLKKMKWERDEKVIESNLISFIESDKSIKNIGFKTGDQLWTPTPGQPGLLEKVSSNILPIVSIGISVYTLYLTYYLISVGR